MRPTLILLAVLAGACTTKNAARSDTTSPTTATLASNTDPAALRRFIDSAQTRYIAAATKADVPTLSAFYADDAVVYEPNRKAMHGRAEIDKGFTDTFGKMKITALKLSTEDLITAGDYAIETGSYDQSIQPKTGKALHDIGKYIVVWKKQADGSWKIVREVYNTDMPAKS